MALVRRSLLRAAWLVSAYAGLFFMGLAVLSAAGDAVVSAMYDPDRVRWLHIFVRVVGGAGAAGLLGVAFLLLAILLRRLLRRVRQREADALGALMVDQLRAGQELTRPFFLYLRAFDTTGRLKLPLFAFDLGSFGLQQLRTNELESVIAAALLKKGVLVALGRPGENLGAGRVVSPDEGWVKDIELLAARAKGILVVPSHHPGTVWEIDHLQRHELLDKTVFLMPPESRRFNWKAHWSEARRGMGSLGSALPEYSELGLLFTVGRDGAVTNAAPFSLFLQRSFRKSILSLLGGKPPRRGPLHALARAERRRAARPSPASVGAPQPRPPGSGNARVHRPRDPRSARQGGTERFACRRRRPGRRQSDGARTAAALACIPGPRAGSLRRAASSGHR
jgi:hypothetical protein